MNHDIKMIGMDFDLTLVDYPPSGAYIYPKTIAYLENLIRQGVEVGIVTGRDIWTMRDILTIAGVRFGDPFPSFVVVRENYIHWLKQNRIDAHDIWNNRMSDQMARFSQTLSAHVSDWIDELAGQELNPRKWILFSDFGLEIHFPTSELAASACLLMEKWLEQVPDMHIHRNRMMANLVHKASGKGYALQQAALAKGFAAKQVLAIGDSLNDLSMLDGSYGFLCGTVENADPVVKQAVMDNKGIVSNKPASQGLLDILEKNFE
jgi:HAD superfamily hydrolase (TIGR01484 family)